MAISQKLHTKLVQKLILTPSLQQAIKLIPMSTLELSELLNQEMVENPMLEEVGAMGPWPTEEVERSLRLVQGFDPIGAASRDLQECLLLQLRHLGMGGTPAERIVTEHMRLLQNHQVPELARKMGLSIDDLKQHIELIRHLDPKPGSRLNPSQSQYVIPDVYVVKVEGQYGAVLNEEGPAQRRMR